MAGVVLEALTKRYGDVTAVDAVDLAVEDRELFVILGPSGCGKSTLLALVAGLERGEAGTVAIGGRVVDDLEPRDRNVAMVFQSYALYPHLTVRGNLAFPLRLARRAPDAIAERVAWAASLLGLEDLLDRKPRELSGGQRQRVAMGRALVRKPDVFLLDEPLANLDSRLRREMRAEIAKVHRAAGATTLYVTHDQVEALTLADRIAVMRGGRVVQVGTPRAIYDVPRHLFVARFLGSPPMNLIRARSENSTLASPIGAYALDGPGAAGPPCEVILGIRPEHVALLDPAASSLTALVEDIEWTGAEAHATVRCSGSEREGDGVTLTVRLAADRVPARGERVGVRLDLARVHLFDPRSEQRIEALVGP